MKKPKNVPLIPGKKLIYVEALVWIDETLTGLDALRAVGDRVATFAPAAENHEGMHVEILR